jgi:hypothetical protein
MLPISRGSSPLTMPSYDEKHDVERESADLKKVPSHHVQVTATGVDDAVRLTMKQGLREPLSPEAALKLRKKIDKHILPLMMIRESMNKSFCLYSEHLVRSILGPIYGQDYAREQCYSRYPDRCTFGCQPVSSKNFFKLPWVLMFGLAW